MFCGLAVLRKIVNKENGTFPYSFLYAAEDFFFGFGAMHHLREENLFKVTADVVAFIDICPMQVVAVGQSVEAITLFAQLCQVIESFLR